MLIVSLFQTLPRPDHCVISDRVKDAPQRVNETTEGQRVRSVTAGPQRSSEATTCTRTTGHGDKMADSKLKMNDDKTELMAIGTRSKLSQVIPYLAPMSISGCDIPFSQLLETLVFT